MGKQKALVTNHCPVAWQKREDVPCCFDDPRIGCHIPWAGIGERVSHPILHQFKKEGKRSSSYCYSGEASFTPEKFGYVLEETAFRHVNTSYALDMFKQGKVKKPLDRLLYHLFNGQFPWKSWSCRRLFDNRTLLGALFSRSYS